MANRLIKGTGQTGNRLTNSPEHSRRVLKYSSAK